MGLRQYSIPDEDDVQHTIAKVEHAAAQRRSAIRREPSIRPGRDQHSSSNLTNILRSQRELRQATARAQRSLTEDDTRIEALEAELSRLRRQRERNTLRAQNEQSRARMVREFENTLSRRQHPPVSDNLYLTTDERPTISTDTTSENAPLPRPARESSLRFEVSATSQTQPWRTIPSPPHSLGDLTTSRPVDGPLDSWDSAPPLTQDFAPAHAARASVEQNETSANRSTEAERNNSSRHDGLETPPPETWEDSYPALRRVPRISPRLPPRSAIDGLGDRHRSPSPASETHEEETWNNLLATMDQGLESPSTATSFASITDLLSTSRTSSHRSSSTQNTSTSFGEIGDTADETCDLPPGITEEDVRQIRERHRQGPRRVMAPRSTNRSHPEPTSRSLDSFVPRSLLHEDPSLSTILREANEPRELDQRSRDELTIFQAIVERQQNHEYIPDEWWALAGIPPNLAHLARTQNES